MKEEQTLSITLLSQDQHEIARVANDLAENLGEEANVSVITESTFNAAGRGLEPMVSLTVIQVALAALQTYIMLSDYLKKSNVGNVIITNSVTRVSVRIDESDTHEVIRRKLRRLMSRRGILGWLFGRKR